MLTQHLMKKNPVVACHTVTQNWMLWKRNCFLYSTTINWMGKAWVPWIICNMGESNPDGWSWIQGFSPHHDQSHYLPKKQTWYSTVRVWKVQITTSKDTIIPKCQLFTYPLHDLCICDQCSIIKTIFFFKSIQLFQTKLNFEVNSLSPL